MKKSLTIAALAALTGCSQVDSHKLVNADGRYLGDVFNVRHSQDGCAWQVVSTFFSPKGELLEHKVGILPGVTCAALEAGARVGGAAMLGHSFPKNVGDSTQVNSTNAQGQGQIQGQQQQQQANSLSEVNAAVSSASGASANVGGGMD